MTFLSHKTKNGWFDQKDRNLKKKWRRHNEVQKKQLKVPGLNFEQIIEGLK